jgi:Domain of unknown function (DUF4259)
VAGHNDVKNEQEVAMGAWGPGPFENDDALDFLVELEAATDWSGVVDALDAVAEAGTPDYIEAPEASVAVAAAEVVAAALGSPRGDLPSEVLAWVAGPGRHGSPPAAALAIRAVERVVAASELAELWADENDHAWQAAVADLSRRLTAGR